MRRSLSCDGSESFGGSGKGFLYNGGGEEETELCLYSGFQFKYQKRMKHIICTFASIKVFLLTPRTIAIVLNKLIILFLINKL